MMVPIAILAVLPLGGAEPAAAPPPVAADPGAEAGRQVPGDADGTGSLDIGDPLRILTILSIEPSFRLPCERGTLADPGPGEREAMDRSGDGTIDLSGVEGAFSYIFAGGSAPVPGEAGVDIGGCPGRCAR